MPNVTKVQIIPFSDQEFTTKVKTDPDNYLLPVNPESYSQSFQIELDERRGHGNQRTNPRFKSTKPEEFKIEFILDGTGVVEGYHNPKSQNVHDQFEAFKKIVYDMSGEIHRPHFLQIVWGKLTFQCILKSLEANFTLFDKKGLPLRAKLNCTFLDFVAQEERTAEERTNSPDLSHVRLVKEGDRLDLMTFDIYKDSKYVLQIAKANGLTSLRNVQPGTNIVFPPFDKTEV